MAFDVIGTTYNNSALGVTAVPVPVPAQINDASGNGSPIRVAKTARIKNPSVNIIYARRDGVASASAYDIMVLPGLEEDLDIERASIISVIASAASTPMSISFGNYILR